MRNKMTILALGSLLLVAAPALAEEKDESGQVRERMMCMKEGGCADGEGMMKHRRSGRHAEMMKKMDKDGNGSVSKAEFIASAEERFAKMDRNGDGKLDQDDRPQRKDGGQEEFGDLPPPDAPKGN